MQSNNFLQDLEEDDDQQFHNARARLIHGHGTSSKTAHHHTSIIPPPPKTISKKKRNLPGNPDPDAEVVALSPRTLMATNRYICEVCHKGFQRDQNLQLHRRGHNLPWKLKQRAGGNNNSEVRKRRVYVCPEPNCVHHEPSRALGDLTGIKKHFCRKHGEKKWKCDKCSKRYAVQSDWKAHAKICGTREYHCDCGTIFSRNDSFVTHRAFCDALAEENYKMNLKAAGGLLQEPSPNPNTNYDGSSVHMSSDHHFDPAIIFNHDHQRPCFSSTGAGVAAAAYTSATALLQKAAEMGAKVSDDNTINPILLRGFTGSYSTISSNSTTVISHVDVDNNTIASALNPAEMLYENSTIMETALTSPNAVGYGISTTTTDHTSTGLYDHHMKGNLLERHVFMGGGTSERTTVDFLGVEPGGIVCQKQRDSCNGNMEAGGTALFK